jgi:ABC-type multidrug transport system fused ATPase/permease subunit
MVLGYDYPLLDFLLSVLWFFLFIAWLWLAFTVIFDIFRSADLSGWGKALWVLFVIFLPFLGVLMYLIVRGGKMHERAAQQAQAEKHAFDDYVRSTAGTSASSADELQKLAGLRDTGVITPGEFDAQKAKILGV